MEDIQQYGCDCYYVSQDPKQYGLKTNKRFDFAHIIPKCTDCNYCNAAFNGSGIFLCIL